MAEIAIPMAALGIMYILSRTLRLETKKDSKELLPFLFKEKF